MRLLSTFQGRVIYAYNYIHYYCAKRAQITNGVCVRVRLGPRPHSPKRRTNTQKYEKYDMRLKRTDDREPPVKLNTPGA